MTANLAKLQLLGAFVALLCAALMTIFGALSVFEIGFEAFLLNDFRLHWSESSTGYWFHCWSALFEWFTVLSLSPYFLTFIPELKNKSWKQLKDVIDSNANQVV